MGYTYVDLTGTKMFIAATVDGGLDVMDDEPPPSPMHYHLALFVQNCKPHLVAIVQSSIIAGAVLGAMMSIIILLTA